MSQIANAAGRIRAIFRQSETVSSTRSLWPDRLRQQLDKSSRPAGNGRADLLIQLCSDAAGVRRFMETLSQSEQELFTSYFLHETPASRIARGQRLPLWRVYENLHLLAEEMLHFLQQLKGKPPRDPHTGRFAKSTSRAK